MAEGVFSKRNRNRKQNNLSDMRNHSPLLLEDTNRRGGGGGGGRERGGGEGGQELLLRDDYVQCKSTQQGNVSFLPRGTRPNRRAEA